MPETIRIGGLELRFLRSKDYTAGSLDRFEVAMQPNARRPVPHYHESWDETVYGLTGTTRWRVGGQDVRLEPGNCLHPPWPQRHAGTRHMPLHPHPWSARPRLFPGIAALLAEGADPRKMKETMLRYGLVPVAMG